MNPALEQPYGLKALIAGVDPVIDLVAVHGLDGHREDTWTAKNGILWLRDYLPTVVPNSRILAYGYDGRTRSSGTPLSCQKLHDHAISLVTELTLYRTETDTSQRPIIFIAHSIGGIIIKDALIHSNSTNKNNLEHHNAIKTSTYGILFFGTPHQGSDIPTWTRMIITASNKKINQEIFSSLEKGSELLQKQLGQYNHISSDFVTKCFYETYKSPSHKNILAVEPGLATIPGATNVEIFSLNGEHGNIVKFKSADDDGFKKVSSCLKLMASDAPAKILENWQRWERIKDAENNGMQITFEIPFESEYPRNQHFTGRQDLLEKLHQTIERSPTDSLTTVVLHGIGGVGKTQVASEYAHDHQKEYQSIFWINAATRDSIELGFKTVAQRLIRQHAKISYGTKPNYPLIAKNLDMIGAVDESGSISLHEVECIIRGVKMWLAKEGNQRWLLIIDNFDDLDKLAAEAFMPTAAHGTIIITTRRPECVSFGIGLEIETMQEQEGKELFLRSAQLKDDPLAGELVTKLGSLPLAIVQAGAYTAVCKMPLKRYLNIYEKRFNEIFGEKPSKATWHYDKTVKTTWEISFQAIKETNEEAAELLSLCSFISNENIRDDILRRGKQLQNDDVTLDALLGLLFSYSLAQRKELDDSFYIHPLVHLWAHKRLGESECRAKTIEALQLVTKATIPSDLKKLEDHEHNNRILPHMHVVSKNVKEHLNIESIDVPVAQGIHRMADILGESGQLKEAGELVLRAVEAMQNNIGKEDRYTLSLMRSLSKTYRSQGRYKKAEELGLQVVQGLQKAFDKEDPDTFLAISDLAMTYLAQGLSGVAENLQLQASEGMQRIIGLEDPRTVEIMSGLAQIYWNQGQEKEAEDLELQIMEARKKVLLKEHPDTLLAMSNLANTYWKDGRKKKAGELQQQVVEAKRKNLGKEHPETIEAMGFLAKIYSSQRLFKQKEELLQQLLEAKRKTFGNVHPETVSTIYNLMETYSSQGRHREAEELMQTIKKNIDQILLAIPNHAATLAEQGRYKEQEEVQSKLTKAINNTIDKTNPAAILATAELVEIYEAQGRHRDAIEMKQEVLKSLVLSDHPDAVQIIGTSQSWAEDESFKFLERVVQEELELEGSNISPALATMQTMVQHIKHGQLREAVKLWKQINDDGVAEEIAEEAAQRAISIGPLLGLDSLQIQAATLSNEERWEEAEEPQLRLLDLLQNALGKENLATLEAMTNLAIIYVNQERLKEAEELQQRVVEGMQCALGNDHLNTHRAAKILAAIYAKQERWKELGELELLLLDSSQRTLGEEDPVTLEAMFQLAITYIRQERLKDAEELLLQVIEIRQRALGEDHPDTDRAVIALSAVYMRHGQRDEAIELVGGMRRRMELMERVQRLEKQKVPENKRPQRGLSISLHTDNLAKSFGDIEDLSDDEKLQKAIEMSLQPDNLGKSSRETEVERDKQNSYSLKTMANQAAGYWRQGRWKEAEGLELKVMEARKIILGDEHPDTIAAIMTLAGTYMNQEKWKEAEELNLQAVRAARRIFENDHPRTLSAMASLATCNWYQGELKKAEILEAKVLEARRRTLGIKHSDTIVAIGNLAATYASQNRYENAEKLQQEVLEALAKIQGRRHSDTLSAQELIQVYRDGRAMRDGREPRREQELDRSERTGTKMKDPLLFSLFFLSFFISFHFLFLCLIPRVYHIISLLFPITHLQL